MSKFFYVEKGKGYPVVFLHGFCETHAIWEEVAESISAQYRAICLDLPGFGQSELPPYELSIEMVANEVYEWLLEKNISECIMIGHSLGGYVTLEIAKKFPNIFKAFGLFQSTAFADSEEKKENRNKTIDFVEKHGVEKFIQSFVPMLFYDKRRDELQSKMDELTEIAKKTASASLISYTRAMRDREENVEILKSFDKPILFVAGEEDSLIPINKSKEQIKWIQHPYVKLIPETGHVAMLERPEESISAIKRFLQVVI